MKEIDLTEILKKYNYRVKLEIEAPHSEIRKALDDLKTNTFSFYIDKMVILNATFEDSIGKNAKNTIDGKKLKMSIPKRPFLNLKFPNLNKP